MMRAMLLASALIAAPAAAETIFVSDEAASCVHAIDGASLKPLGCIEVGDRPRGLVVSSDRKRLYVAVSNANRIAVIDTASRRVLRTFDSGSDPETFALTPDEKKIYIGNEDSNLLTVIDIASGTVEREILVGGEPEGTAVSPDGRLAVQASETSSMAHVVDTASGEILANLMVDTRPRYVAFTPDGKRFWVTSEVRGTLTVFDSATLKSVGKVDFEAANLTDGVIQPVGIRFTRDGRRAFVALGRGKLVAEVDPEKLTIRRTWPVGFRAWNLALSPDERRLYTADGLDGTMSVIDLAANAPLAPVKLGGKPWGIEVVP
ncbi:MAG TPA: PQQ-dependent catabolism-associated beta-propeller protein [Sphingomicrobium sp.]|jgi:PQQ-dependent catabolism-associated beta-propeller protein|nr:PQQ-dependent catabolism-associated beta-propeller protein [Sphingomicrobium sp.]